MNAGLNILTRGSRVKLTGRNEWPHFKNKAAIVTKIAKGAKGPIGFVVALKSAKETIKLLRFPNEIEQIEEQFETKTDKQEQKGDIEKMATSNTKNNGFERFMGPARLNNCTKVPTASLISKGILAFNRGACELYGVLENKFYVAFYNKANKKIGIQFTNNEQEPGARSFSRKKDGHYAHLSVKTFLQHYGISTENRKYIISQGDGGMLILTPVEVDKKTI